MAITIPCPVCGTHLSGGILAPCPKCGWTAPPGTGEAMERSSRQMMELLGQLQAARIRAWAWASASLLFNRGLAGSP
jgi:hypothetical protein